MIMKVYHMNIFSVLKMFGTFILDSRYYFFDFIHRSENGHGAICQLVIHVYLQTTVKTCIRINYKMILGFHCLVKLLLDYFTFFI